MAAPKKEARAVEVDGIKVDVALDPQNDFEIIECNLTVTDPDAEPIARARARYRIAHLVLGDSYESAMDALREKNGGTLRFEDAWGFVEKVIAAVPEAKN